MAVIEVYYEDLSSYIRNLREPINFVRNAGWLDSAHDFKTGKAPEGLLKKLEALISSSGTLDIHVSRIRGVRPCSVCKEHGPFKLDHFDVVVGSSMLWIPDIEEGCYWAVPSLIYHYIKDHGYYPPEGFIQAVMALSLESNFNAQNTYLDSVAGHF